MQCSIGKLERPWRRFCCWLELAPQRWRPVATAGVPVVRAARMLQARVALAARTARPVQERVAVGPPVWAPEAALARVPELAPARELGARQPARRDRAARRV
jgi:hypothetical protein